MMARLMAFGCGALVGAFGTIVSCWFHYGEIFWWSVGFGALVFGLLAAIFGSKFFETLFSRWDLILILILLVIVLIVGVVSAVLK